MDNILKEISNVNTLIELEEIRVKFLGKNGIITQKLKNIATLSHDEKITFGKLINDEKNNITFAINKKKIELQKEEEKKKLEEDAIDITLPPIFNEYGSFHPLTIVKQKICSFFGSFGFILHDGPEIEDEFHNFDGLNIPKHHPARNVSDTFYLKDFDMLLRTHTSNVQIRTMKKTKPPLRILSIGKVYRNDSIDATHTPMFHQAEGLLIEPGINMCNLKWILKEFLKFFFEKDDIEIRFRPSFFPFTEPSAEIDIKYNKDGRDVWLEILGCGMVHPNVLEKCEIDAENNIGFAFGIGIERLLMLKENILDIRNLYENDPRWIYNYGANKYII